jgi:beta-glucosidase/6-phospho-beta-glucosidase/beta-galactosidase
MTDFGFNAYRFSLSWDKLQPRENGWDASVADHYIAMLDALAAKGTFARAHA